MSIQERKQMQHDQLRSTILEESWKIVEAEGWNALSIRKIADAISYSVPMVYKHFESKDELVLVFTRQGYGQLAGQLHSASLKSDSPREKLILIAYAYARFASEQPKFYQLMFGLGMPTCEQLQEVEEMKNVSDIIFHSVQQLIESNSYTEQDMRLKARTFWSLLHGLIAINTVSVIECTEENKRLMDDAVSGFIKTITD